MADEKKPEKPGGDKPAPAKSDPFVEIVWFLVIAYLAVTALTNLLSFFNNSDTFSNGWRGLTPRGLVLSHTKPISSLENPLGSRVIVSSYRADLFDFPGDHKIGVKKLGDKGYITAGSVEINGIKYWRVEFDNGSDGWIKEDYIRYLEKELPWYVKLSIFIWKMIPYLEYLLYLAIIALAGFIYYLYSGVVKLRRAEAEKLYPEGIVEKISATTITNLQWEKVLMHSASESESDWRLAILEADIMLSELLENLSLPGDTIGEKLKAIERSDFLTLDNAWEAHMTRNNIAHKGMNFMINKELVRRTIALYQTVFEEFNIIEKVPTV